MWRNVVAALLMLVASGSFARADGSSAAQQSSRLNKVNRLIAEENWGEAEAYMLADIAELRAQAGNRDNDLTLGLALSLLAKVYVKHGRPNDAVLALNEAVEVINRHADLKDDEVRVHINSGFGDALRDRREFELAQVYYERAIGYADKPRADGINPNHLTTARVLTGFAQNGISVLDEYQKQGKSRQMMLGQASKMEAAFKRAGVIFEEQLGADHDDTKFVRKLAADIQRIRELLSRNSG